MNKREEILLDKALEYKKQYKDCAWWKFRERRDLYKSWQSTLELIFMYDSK